METQALHVHACMHALPRRARPGRGFVHAHISCMQSIIASVWHVRIAAARCRWGAHAELLWSLELTSTAIIITATRALEVHTC